MFLMMAVGTDILKNIFIPVSVLFCTVFSTSLAVIKLPASYTKTNLSVYTVCFLSSCGNLH